MPAWTDHEEARFLSCARCGDRPPSTNGMVERPGRFYIVVRTASVRRRIRSSAPRKLLRRPTILAGEEPTDEADPVHEEQPESRTLGDPPSVHPAPTPATERQSRADPPHRSGGVLGPAPLPPTSRRPLDHFESGRPRTTITASPWPFRAALRPKNWPRSARRCAQRRHLVSTRARYLNSGVNLDETQHATL